MSALNSSLRPILDQVLLQKQKTTSAPKGGILLAGKAKEASEYRVVSVGKGGFVNGKEVKMYLQPQDVVIIRESMGTQVLYQGEEYVIIRQEDVLAHVIK